MFIRRLGKKFNCFWSEGTRRVFNIGTFRNWWIFKCNCFVWGGESVISVWLESICWIKCLKKSMDQKRPSSFEFSNIYYFIFGPVEIATPAGKDIWVKNFIAIICTLFHLIMAKNILIKRHLVPSLEEALGIFGC